VNGAHPLVDRVDAFVQHEGLLQPGQRVLLAISGGLDSTTLLHYLNQAGYRVGLAHCNYGRRGAESDADEEFVVELARKWDCPVHVTHYPIPTSSEPGIASPPTEPKQPNFQEGARHYRYKYFKKILDEYKYEILCTAHHLDDNLETLLINLGRGSGLAGLAGIPVRTDFPLVRPFLCVSRREIEDYARHHRVDWREDASNQSDDYLRNRIRHHLVPVLREVLNLTEGSLERSLRHLRSGLTFYERGIGAYSALLSEEDGQFIFDCASNQL
jgi:tRNA(Ile)-lysidine synthase